jgi:hypothetical protein
VRRAQPADAGGVDEDKAAGEQLARQPDLRVAQQCLVARVARLRDVLGELPDRHLGALGRVVAVTLPDERDPGFLGVLDGGRYRRGDVVVHRADRRVDERVHKLALALLELPDDEHAHVGIREPLAGLEQPPTEIGTLVRGGRLQRQVDKVDRCGNGHGSLPPSHPSLVSATSVGRGPHKTPAPPLGVPVQWRGRRCISGRLPSRWTGRVTGGVS